MASAHKIFPDQAYVDALNAQLPQGISFQAHDHMGQLVMNVRAVESVLNNQTTLDPADNAAVRALPELIIEEQSDLDEARLVAIEDRLDLIEGRLDDLENP